uniref:Uncharacterized protein n=2 Tax=Klebsiella pneumoniae TaxID=573 RepID=A0A6G9HK88_KLEPN|nr:hypothetical protein A7K71_83 [Klebsiella pneumoniae subsp. pneumoniae]QIQ11131.1 hypothetical protein [Klebsiella pneumoniae]
MNKTKGCLIANFATVPFRLPPLKAISRTLILTSLKSVVSLRKNY